VEFYIAGHTIASGDAEKLSGFLCIFQSPDGILTVDLNSSQQVYAEAEQEAIACWCNNERMCEFGVREQKTLACILYVLQGAAWGMGISG
jgi:hypothetical protein